MFCVTQYQFSDLIFDQSTLNAKAMSDPWDVLVVGGGVVGAAIAREFAASGKRVLLCEKEDEVVGNLPIFTQFKFSFSSS